MLKSKSFPVAAYQIGVQGSCNLGVFAVMSCIIGPCEVFDSLKFYGCNVHSLNGICVYFSNRSFLIRNDIGIILINQFIAEMIRHAIDAHMQSIPAVLEIPSKEHPYDASKDSILRRAKGMFSAEDFR